MQGPPNAGVVCGERRSAPICREVTLHGAPHSAELPPDAPAAPPSGSPQVAMHFQASPQASAVQWLEPAQTAGKKHPYLFTQVRLAELAGCAGVRGPLRLRCWCWHCQRVALRRLPVVCWILCQARGSALLTPPCVSPSVCARSARPSTPGGEQAARTPGEPPWGASREGRLLSVSQAAQLLARLVTVQAPAACSPQPYPTPTPRAPNPHPLSPPHIHTVPARLPARQVNPALPGHPGRKVHLHRGGARARAPARADERGAARGGQERR